MKRLTAVVGLLVLTLAGCGGGPGSPTDATPLSPFVFSVSPLEITKIRSIQRMVHHPNRTFPYILMRYSEPGGLVRAPAEAVVTAVTATIPSSRIDFTTAWGMRYYLTDLASVEVGEGVGVSAGQVVGTVGQSFDGVLPSIGFGVVSPDTTQRFITPGRYPDEWLHADSPLRYFREPSRGLLMAAVQPPGLGEGQLCYDTPGTLQGFWYLASVPPGESVSDEYLDARLWFYYNDLNPAERIVAYTGQGLKLTSSRVRDDDPVASQVTPSSGRVSFRFVRRVGEFPNRIDHDFVLLVEMLSSTSLRAEAIDTTLVPEPTFGPNGRIYVR